MSSSIRTVNPEEYLKTPRPQLSWIVDGLIPRPANLLLMGPPKVGKSFLAWDIATKIAQGKPVLGYHTVAPHKVLYLQLDTKEAAWTERLRTLQNAGYPLNIPNLYLVHQDDMMLPLLVTTPRGREFIRQVLEQVDPALIVFDVLRELHEEDENDSTSMKKVFDALEPLTKETSVLFLHHTRKMNTEDKGTPDPVALARGSSYITGRVDGYWLLYGDAPMRKLTFESRFQESTRTIAKQDPNTGIFTFPDLEHDATTLPKLLKVCADNPTKGHGELWKEACNAAGISRSTYFRIIHSASCVHSTVSSGPSTDASASLVAPRDPL